MNQLTLELERPRMMEKTTIYGLPITPARLLDDLAGASFCVSYAHRKRLGKQLDQAIELVGENGVLLIDNGAFTNHKQGKSSFDEDYLADFAQWATDILDRCPQAWVVLPDVIDGSPEQNAQLISEMMTVFPADRCMPVWHLHEPISYLLDLCEGFEYVALGSSGQYWQVGTPAWHGRMREIFKAIDQWEADSEYEGHRAYIRPRLHMMRAQSMAHLYPFDSSDSSNVAVNHWRYKGEGEGYIGRLAARVDARIQATAGDAAEHQVKRPLQQHIDRRAWQWECLLRDAKDTPALKQESWHILSPSMEATGTQSNMTIDTHIARCDK